MTEMNAETRAFWLRCLDKLGLPEDTKCMDIYHFELTERLANELLELVLSGQKRATASSLFSMQAEGIMPVPGDMSIITDWAGTPRCAVRTVKVSELRFCDMTFDICSREGEDDCLESWQRGHRKFFTGEGLEMGYEFSEDMPIVFEDFEVVYRESADDGAQRK